MCSVLQSYLTLCDHMDCSPPGSSVHGILQARITGVGCHALLQGIFLTQGSNPCLLHWQVGSLPLSHLGITIYRLAAAKSLQSCPTLQPHRWQSTRLPRPWESPGKNIGMGCHFLFQCMKMESESEFTQLCPTLHDPMECSPPGSSVPGILQARTLEWVVISFSSV